VQGDETAVSTETRLPAAARSRITREELLRFLAEAVALVGAMLVYWLIRGAVPERIAESFGRADSIIDLEQRLGIFVELRWQEYIIDSTTLMKLANWVYVWGHLPVLIAAAVWIYVRNRERFRVYRNALLISAVIGLFFYGFFPVAPPRLMPEWGFVDTQALLNPENYSMQPGFFVNHYAAVPSFHVGWALLVGIALFDVDRRLAVRVFAVALPIVQFVAVVLTANHFILDVVAGMLVVLVAVGVALMIDSGRFAPWRTLRQRVEVDG
jgi:hypothetical protein